MRWQNVIAVFAICVCGLCMVCASAQAAAPQAEVSFAIPPQPLSSALVAFSQQARVQVLSAGAKAKSIRSPGVSGKFTVGQALSRLLNGTGFTGEFTDATTVVIRYGAHRPAAQKGSASTAKKSKLLYSLGEIEVYGHVPALSATRSDTPVKEIPQTVSVISRQMLDQQNASDLASALEFAPGIQLQRTNGLWSAYARGFSVDQVHIDGGAPIQLLTGPVDTMNRNLAEYDDITVLRGSDALFGGMGAPSATVSMNRKMPTPTFQASMNMRAGSWDQYRAEGDVSGPLTKKLSGRLVVSGSTQDYFYNTRHRWEGMLYGVLQYQFSPSTSLAFGGSHQKSQAHGFVRGLPLFDNGADPHLPRSTSLALPWTTMRNAFSEGFVKLKHDFSKNWKLEANATYLKAKSPLYVEASYSGPIDSTTDELSAGFTPSASTFSDVKKLANATLTGSFNWLGQKQRIMIGGDYAHSSGSGSTLLPNYDQTSLPIDPFHFDPSLYPAPDFSPGNLFLTSDTNNLTVQWGLYGSIRLQPLEGLSFVAGGRLSEYRSHNTRLVNLPGLGFSLPPTDSGFTDKHKFTPYFGVTYDITPHYTWYASFADIYETNAGATNKENVALRPANGNTMETGIKGAWNHNMLNASFALFKVNQTGVAAYDPSTPPTAGPNCCFVPETIRSKGLQVTVSGMVTPRWQLLAGYTYAKLTTTSTISLILPPTSVLKLWTNYKLPGGHWSIGGGARAYSTNHIGTCGTYSPDFSSCLQFIRFSQSSYAVVDLRAAYAVNASWSVALNLNNLFDRRYYSMLEALTDNNWYGAPRNFMVTVTGRF